MGRKVLGWLLLRKAIREYLEAKLRALERARADGTEVQGLPGRIIFGPAPKNAIEAGLHGVLEGLYVSGKLNGREAGEWHAKFRSAMAAPGDPGTVSILIGGSIPADVAARNEPWAPDTMIAAVEPEIPARDYDSGLLALKRAELYPFGVTLHWILELSEKAQANVQKARKDLAKSPPDLLEFHLTRTLLPAVQAMSMSDARAQAFSLLDMDSNFSQHNQVRAATRLTPSPELPAQLTVVWAGLTFAFRVDTQNRNADNARE